MASGGFEKYGFAEGDPHLKGAFVVLHFAALADCGRRQFAEIIRAMRALSTSALRRVVAASRLKRSLNSQNPLRDGACAAMPRADCGGQNKRRFGCRIFRSSAVRRRRAARARMTGG